MRSPPNSDQKMGANGCFIGSNLAWVLVELGLLVQGTLDLLTDSFIAKLQQRTSFTADTDKTAGLLGCQTQPGSELRTILELNLVPHEPELINSSRSRLSAS